MRSTPIGDAVRALSEELDFLLPTARGLEEINREVARQYGGTAGVRDSNALHACVASVANRVIYGGERDIRRLAGLLAWKIARAHPFVDGNKRTALLAGILLAHANGYLFRMEPHEVSCVHNAMRIAAGERPAEPVRRLVEPFPSQDADDLEESFIRWFASRLVPGEAQADVRDARAWVQPVCLGR